MTTLRERFLERNPSYEEKLTARRAELTPKTKPTPLECFKAHFPNVVKVKIARDHTSIHDMIAENQKTSAIRDEMVAWIESTSVCEAGSHFSIEHDETTGRIAAFLYGGFESPADAFSYKLRWA